MVVRFLLCLVFMLFGAIGLSVSLDEPNSLYEQILYFVGGLTCIMGALVVAIL